METRSDSIHEIVQACLNHEANQDQICTAIINATENEYEKAFERDPPECLHEIKARVADALETVFDLVCDELEEENSTAAATFKEVHGTIDSETLAREVADTLHDGHERDRDPYRYYGVSPSDFY